MAITRVFKYVVFRRLWKKGERMYSDSPTAKRQWFMSDLIYDTKEEAEARAKKTGGNECVVVGIWIDVPTEIQMGLIK